MEDNKDGLAILRKPFPLEQISKLPKPNKQQTEEVKANFNSGIRCQVCGGWHHPKVVHLDYVGHAALTNRLLEADINWSWEPVAFDEKGLPLIDKDGGLWIKLTVCGVTRLGYGDAPGKTGSDATKERIGDALRNAAMRFGAALDLWSKADLHKEGDEDVIDNKKTALLDGFLFFLQEAQNSNDLKAVKNKIQLLPEADQPKANAALVKKERELKSAAAKKLRQQAAEIREAAQYADSGDIKRAEEEKAKALESQADSLEGKANITTMPPASNKADPKQNAFL